MPGLDLVPLLAVLRRLVAPLARAALEALLDDDDDQETSA